MIHYIWTIFKPKISTRRFNLRRMFKDNTFVIYKPGGSINLNKRINVENSYDIKGSYSMNYVTVVKGNLPSLIIASIMPNWDIKKESDITGGLDYDLSFKLEQIELKNSLFLATYNAYTKANKNITINDKKHYITYISEESDTDLQPLDQIISIDGKNYENLKDFQEYISSLEVNDKISIIVIRNNNDVKFLPIDDRFIEVMEKSKYCSEYDKTSYVQDSNYIVKQTRKGRSERPEINSIRNRFNIISVSNGIARINPTMLKDNREYDLLLEIAEQNGQLITKDFKDIIQIFNYKNITESSIVNKSQILKRQFIDFFPQIKVLKNR